MGKGDIMDNIDSVSEETERQENSSEMYALTTELLRKTWTQLEGRKVS